MVAPRKPARGKTPRAAANAARGEHSLTLAGKAYVLRPSFEASQGLEEELGRSLHELFRGANTLSLTYADLGAICAAYIRAGAAEGDRLTAMVSDARIAELIYEEGTAQVFPVLTLLLADAISGGRTSSGEAKAVTTTPATT